MRKKKFLSVVALSGLLTLGVAATTLASCGDDKVEVTKYTVSVSTSSDYSVTGIDNKGYEAGATVTFKVTVTNEEKEIDKVTLNGNNLAGTDGNYSFSMPSQNSTIVITLKNKEVVPPVTETLTVTTDKTEYKVGETFTLIVKRNNAMVTSFTATSNPADALKIEGSNVTALKAYDEVIITVTSKDSTGTKDLTATVKIKISVDESNVLKTFTEIYEFAKTEVPNNKDESETYVSTKGVVISTSGQKENTEYENSDECDVVLFDGTTYLAIHTKSTSNGESPVYDMEVGKTYIVKGTLSNYFGLVQINDRAKTPTEVTEVTDEGETILVPNATNYTGKQFKAFYDHANSVNASIKDNGSVKPAYAKFSATKIADDGEGKSILLEVSGEGTTKYNINVIKSNDTLLNSILKDMPIGAKYDMEGSIIGFNSKYNYFNVLINKATQKFVSAEGMKFTNVPTSPLKLGDSITLNLSYDDMEAANNPVTWESNEPDVAKVENGLVTALSEGKTIITARNNGESVNCEINVSSEQAKSTLNISDTTNGTVISNITGEVNAGTEATLTITPNEGYEIDKLLVNNIDVTDNITNGTYKFILISGENTVSATFKLDRATAITKLSEISEIEANTVINVEGKILAIAQQGIVIHDGTDIIFINRGFNATVDISSFNVGDSIKVTAFVSTYYGNKTLDVTNQNYKGEGNLVFSASKIEKTFEVPEISQVTWGTNELKAYGSKEQPKPIYVKIDNVKYIKSGNYNNFELGDFASGSIVSPREDMNLENGKYYNFEGYMVYSTSSGTSSGFKNIILTKVTEGEAPKATAINLKINGSENAQIKETRTGTLSYEITPTGASLTDVVFEITEGGDHISIEGNVVTAKSIGTAKVVAKSASTNLTSNEVTIEVVENTSGTLTENTKTFDFKNISGTKIGDNYQYLTDSTDGFDLIHEKGKSSNALRTGEQSVKVYGGSFLHLKSTTSYFTSITLNYDTYSNFKYVLDVEFTTGTGTKIEHTFDKEKGTASIVLTTEDIQDIKITNNNSKQVRFTSIEVNYLA